MNQKGFSLIEVLIALAVTTCVSVSFLIGLTTSSRAALKTDNMDTGRAIAQSQMEYVKQQDFQSSGDYQVNTDLMNQYPGYTVSIPTASTAPQRDGFIQNIIVIVSSGGREVSRLEDYKVKR
jgi:prepilin-type N-terminal cleavage/methylation domain-containing protein